MAKKKIVYPVVFMVLLTIFFATTLAVIDYISEDRIEQQNAARVQKSILYVFNQSVEGDITEQYEKVVTEELINDERVYFLHDNGIKTAYAIRFSGKGLWGQVTGFIAIDIASNDLMGVDFVSHSETPGLGGRIDEEVFKQQFRGVSIADNDGDYIKFSPAQDGIDAISGATLTSKAVQTLINDSIDYAKTLGVTE